MEEMHRTHKEPVWGWMAVVADLFSAARKSDRAATPSTTREPGLRRVVTPWSPRSVPGWSA